MRITYEDFERVDLRSGTVVNVEEFSRAKKPAYKIWVDFGYEIGVLQTSAQVTANYTPEALVGRQVVGCVNLVRKTSQVFYRSFCLWGLLIKTEMFL
jgi:tRNA-binding protein